MAKKNSGPGNTGGNGSGNGNSGGSSDGRRRVVIVGGVRTPFVKAFGQLIKVDSIGLGVAALGKLWPINEILPTRPKIAERTTGEVMGEAADKMARRNEVSRAAQDEFAYKSHARAAAAIASGRFASEVAPITTPEGVVHNDN